MKFAYSLRFADSLGLCNCRQYHAGDVSQPVLLGCGARPVLQDAVGAGLHPANPHSRHMSLVLVQHLQKKGSAGGFVEVYNSDCHQGACSDQNTGQE